jgi:hypothetical protein
MNWKRRIAVALCITGLLCVESGLWRVGSRVSAGIPGDSTIAVSAGGCMAVCPGGDGQNLSDLPTGDATIFIRVKDVTGAPIPGVPAVDFWLAGCNDDLFLVGGQYAINADSATGADGRTTISGTIAAGGCDSVGVLVLVQGVVVEDPPQSGNPLCLDITPISPDLKGSGTATSDGAVDILDFAAFAAYYPAPVVHGYRACHDFNCDDSVDIVDFAVFAQHYLH